MKSDQEFINGIYEKASRYAELEQTASGSFLTKFFEALRMRRFVRIMAPCLCALAAVAVILLNNEPNDYITVQPEGNMDIQSTSLEKDSRMIQSVDEPVASLFSVDLQLTKEQLEIRKAAATLIVTGKVISLDQEGEDRLVTIDVGECFLGTGKKQVVLRYNFQEMLVPETGLPFESFFALEEQVLVFLTLAELQSAVHNLEYQLGESGREGKLTYIGEEDGDAIYQAADGSKIGVSQLR